MLPQHLQGQLSIYKGKHHFSEGMSSLEGERNCGHPGHAQWVTENNPLNIERMDTENYDDEMEDDKTGDN